VVVAAVGRRNTLTADMVKPGAVVIDVGMNRNDEGKLCGDVDFAGVSRGRRLDHAGARRRRPDDHHDAAGEHDRSGRTQSNPLPERTMSDQSPARSPRLPRFDAIRPSTSRRRSTQLLAEADAALEKATSDDVPADYDALSAVLDVATERLGAPGAP
jgi:hypothetical protein